MRTDFPCANKYQQTGDDLYANDKTFDIATWNVAWFGTKQIRPLLENQIQIIQKKLLKMFYNN
jgi:hypothetical protein